MHATALKLFFISFFISLSALASRGDLYLQKAIEQKLWGDESWVRLGHYNKSVFGNYHSSFRGPFFISPEGHKSPEKELVATIKALFINSTDLTPKYGRHPQCQFLARRRWLAQRLRVEARDLQICTERETWKKNLNVRSVSLIFAAADLGNPSSSYGHTFLKLVNPDNAGRKDLIDYGINYAAEGDSSEGFMYALKGLLGFYGGRFAMLPYHQKIREYINLEGRDIWEYPLALSPDEVDFLIDHLLELEASEAPYYFFTDNCSYEILKVLEVLRPSLKMTSFFTLFVIPIDTVKITTRKTNLISDRIFKKSLKTDYVESFSKLSPDQKDELDTLLAKKTISPSNQLSKKEKAEIYETATKFLAVKSYPTGKNFEEEIYRYASDRAILGDVTIEQKVRVIQPPDDSHDSSAVYLGGAEKFYSFKFRSAFHDLEQPDFGTVHMSQTEMGVFDFRYLPDFKKLTLDRFTLVDLVNMNPSNQLDRNISWKIRADLRDRWRPELEGGGGMSFDFNFAEGARLGAFLTGLASPDRKNEIHSDEAYGLGPELLLLLRPISTIGVSLDATYFGVLKKSDFFRVRSKLNWNVAHNFDLQIEGENLYHGKSEVQVRVAKNFLF